jgi:hypothetical protein
MSVAMKRRMLGALFGCSIIGELAFDYAAQIHQMLYGITRWDDTPTVQRWIDQAGPRGHLELPHARYRLATALRLPTAFDLSGRGSVIAPESGDESGITISGACSGSFFYVHDFYIKAPIGFSGAGMAVDGD